MLKASIIIPARNAVTTLGQAVESALNDSGQDDVEIIIVNDGLDKTTNQLVRQYPVKLLNGDGRGAASARNIGVKSSSGEILIFLDADCVVLPGWFMKHIETHNRYGNLLAVGGSVSLNPNSSFWAHCDHYNSWYNVNLYKQCAWVPNHPALNLSFSRKTFECVGPFKEDLSGNGVHEESEWEGRLLHLGGRIRFVPQASVLHIDRDNFKEYMKHNYQWGYNSIEVKSLSNVSRFPWVYKKPRILVYGFPLFAIVLTIYTVMCWLKAGRLKPLLFTVFLFIGRLSYAYGMAIGGIRQMAKNQKKIEGESDAY